MNQRKIFFIILMAYNLILAAGSNNKHFYTGFSSRESGTENFIQYRTPEFELKQIVKDGKSFVKPIMKNSGTVSSTGQPFLPSTSTYYGVEPGTSFGVNINIISSEVIQNVDIFPMVGLDSEEFNGDNDKGNEYHVNAFFPPEIVSVSNPIIFP